MTKEEYLDRLKIFAGEYEAKKREAMREYCLSNNIVNVGDIVTDQIGSVKVESISVSANFGSPCCLYNGIELKKDLKPKKNGSRRSVYQSNIIWVNAK